MITYRALINAFPPRPIKSDEELANVQAIADLILQQEDTREISDDERDCYNVLNLLIKDYKANDDIDLTIPDAKLVMEALLSDRALRKSKLGDIIGSKERADKFWAGEVKLSIKEVNKIGAYFNIPSTAFVNCILIRN